MVSVNCGAIPEGLSRVNLRSWEGCVYNAADLRRVILKLRWRNHFPDEIGEMRCDPGEVVTRAWERWVYARWFVCSGKTEVRVIAATNKLLDYEVQQKHFRPDLYFRWDQWIYTFHSSQQEGRYSNSCWTVCEETTQKKRYNLQGITDDATELLMGYRWPVISASCECNWKYVSAWKRKRLNGYDVQKYVHEKMSVITDETCRWYQTKQLSKQSANWSIEH